MQEMKSRKLKLSLISIDRRVLQFVTYAHSCMMEEIKKKATRKNVMLNAVIDTQKDKSQPISEIM